jgi:hypothetical protein
MRSTQAIVFARSIGFHARLFCVITCAIYFAITPIEASAQRANKPYVEDISAYRPTFEWKADTAKKIQQYNIEVVATKPTNNINVRLHAILDSIDRQNLQKKFVDGFTIQIYSGQNREEATNTKQKVLQEFAVLTSSLQYVQPKWRVTVGSYFSKLEGQKDLNRLKSYFSGAILVPEKIQIR